MVIGEIVERNLWRYPDKTAICFEDTRLSFKQFSQRIYRLANALRSLGFKKGDAVAFLLPHNMIEAQEIIFALAVAGIIIVPVNARFSEAEILHLISNCSVKGIIFEHYYNQLMRSIRPSIKEVQILVSIGESNDNDLYSYETLIAQSSPNRPDVGVREEEVAALIHTSGTTGMPKEAMWTHKSWLTGSRDAVIKFQLTEKDSLLMFTPYFHVPFFWWNLAVSYMSGCIVLIRRPDPELILNAIAKEKITNVSHFVPTTLLRMLDFEELDRYDLSSIKRCLCGGAPIPSQILERAIAKLGNIFIKGYGFTEMAGLVATLPPEDHLLSGGEKQRRRMLSCGKEWPSNDVRIIDGEGKPVGPGEEGEIIYRSDNLMKGYWKNPEETRNVLIDGWFRTGDMGFVDEDKYIYITGRKKEIIISGGENISPKQVEDIIYRHPAVEMVAVIGVSDDKCLEAVKSVFVLKKYMKSTDDSIIILF